MVGSDMRRSVTEDTALWEQKEVQMFVVAVNGDRRRTFVNRLLEADRVIYEREKQACDEMELKPNQWCAQKNGDERISYDRLMHHEDEWHRVHAVLTLRDLGLPGMARAALAYVKAKRAVAKMDAAPAAERKQIA